MKLLELIQGMNQVLLDLCGVKATTSHIDARGSEVELHEEVRKRLQGFFTDHNLPFDVTIWGVKHRWTGEGGLLDDYLMTQDIFTYDVKWMTRDKRFRFQNHGKIGAVTIDIQDDIWKKLHKKYKDSIRQLSVERFLILVAITLCNERIDSVGDQIKKLNEQVVERTAYCSEVNAEHCKLMEMFYDAPVERQ